MPRAASNSSTPSGSTAGSASSSRTEPRPWLVLRVRPRTPWRPDRSPGGRVDGGVRASKTSKKRAWGALKGHWVPPDIRDQIVNFIRYWRHGPSCRSTDCWLGSAWDAANSPPGRCATAGSTSILPGFHGISGWRTGKSRPSSASTRPIPRTAHSGPATQERLLNNTRTRETASRHRWWCCSCCLARGHHSAVGCRRSMESMVQATREATPSVQ